MMDKEIVVIDELKRLYESATDDWNANDYMLIRAAMAFVIAETHGAAIGVALAIEGNKEVERLRKGIQEVIGFAQGYDDTEGCTIAEHLQAVLTPRSAIDPDKSLEK